MKVSIIIPVFNVEKFVAQTLDSVLSQSYEDIEVVIVDDCGTDSSMQIVQSYKDSRIKVVSNGTNRGLFYSRQSGFEHATGEFVMFVDSDDLLEKDAVEVSLKAALEKSAQMVAFNFEFFRDGQRNVGSNLPNEFFETNEKFVRFLYGRKQHYTSCCAVLYGREFLQQVFSALPRFEHKLLMWEDSFFNFFVYSFAERVVLLSDVFYLYRYNPKSITTTRDVESWQRAREDCKFVLEQFRANKEKAHPKVYKFFVMEREREMAGDTKAFLKKTGQLKFTDILAFKKAKLVYSFRRFLRFRFGV